LHYHAKIVPPENDDETDVCLFGLFDIDLIICADNSVEKYSMKLKAVGRIKCMKLQG